MKFKISMNAHPKKLGTVYICANILVGGNKQYKKLVKLKSTKQLVSVLVVAIEH
jgi:hypothetical protein